MKHLKSKIFFFSMFFLVMAASACSQKYNIVADVLKLNKEYSDLGSEIEELTTEINTARSNLSAYNTEANRAEDKAIASAENSSEKASKATSGDMKDAERAETVANSAYGHAKDSKLADEKVKKQEVLIDKLTRESIQKQQRRLELETMCNEIRQLTPCQHSESISSE